MVYVDTVFITFVEIYSRKLDEKVFSDYDHCPLGYAMVLV